MKQPSQFDGNLGGFETTAGTGSIMRAQPSTRTGYAFATCTMKTDNPSFPGQLVIRCTASQSGGVFTQFRVNAGSGWNFVYGSRDLAATTATNYPIDLGVFTGSQCV
jgi:hypothetical protein